MNLAHYIEEILRKSPICNTKEELAEMLGVNYKTLCGWFNRNAFNVETLFSISRVLEIDLEELRTNLPLSNKEVIQLYNKKYSKTPYELEGYFIIKGNKNNSLSQPKKIYSLQLDYIEVNMELRFVDTVSPFLLKEADIKELLKGYEVTVEFETNLSFSFYIKKQGDYLIRKMLENFTDFKDSKAVFSKSYITEKEIDVFFEKIRMGDFEYYGEVVETVGNQPIEKWIEITPVDIHPYKNRILYLK
jgi:Bacteriophage CI repressor helix-turn-helix domain